MSHSTTRIALAVLAALGLAGCKDATRPEAAEDPPATPPAAPVPGILGARAALEDATIRLLPSIGASLLEGQMAEAELRGYLDDLGRALRAGDVVRARVALGRARKMLDFEALRETAGADVAQIELALDHAERELNGEGDPEQAASEP